MISPSWFVCGEEDLSFRLRNALSYYAAASRVKRHTPHVAREIKSYMFGPFQEICSSEARSQRPSTHRQVSWAVCVWCIDLRPPRQNDQDQSGAAVNGYTPRPHLGCIKLVRQRYGIAKLL